MRRVEIGEDVLGRDGSRLGRVERIVVDESSHRVTHLVLHGRAVPAEAIRDAGLDGLAADLDRAALRALPDASEPPFAAPGEHWRAPAGYALGSFLSIAGALFGQAPYSPPTAVDVEAGGIHEITSGSPVWSGGERLGTVREVLSDEAGELSALVVELPGILGADVLLPAARVTRIVGNNVHTDLSRKAARALDRAPR